MPVTITFDVEADAADVAAALTEMGFQVEQNSYVDLHWERGGGIDVMLGGTTGSGKAVLSDYGGEEIDTPEGKRARIPCDYAIRHKTFAADGIGIKQVGGKTVVLMDDSLHYEARLDEKVKKAVREGMGRKIVSKAMGIARSRGSDVKVEEREIDKTHHEIEFRFPRKAVEGNRREDTRRDTRRDQSRVRGH